MDLSFNFNSERVRGCVWNDKSDPNISYPEA